MPDEPTGSRRAGTASQLLLWLPAFCAGVVVYLWVARSLIAAGVASWHVFESLHLILRLRPHGHRVVLASILLRTSCSAVALATAYLVSSPWDRVIALAYILLLVLEEVCHLLLRWVSFRSSSTRGWAVIDAVRAQGCVGTAPREAAGLSPRHVLRIGEGRDPWAMLCALLFIPTLPITLYLYGAREVALDTRFYISRFRESGLYEAVADLTGQAAADLAGTQKTDVRRAIALLPEEEVARAARLLLPEPWATAVLEQALDTTVDWLQSDGGRRVPPISLPIGDLQRHTEDAASVLLDQYASTLPTCTQGGSRDALCRPGDWSVPAFLAARKTESMLALDEAFARIPAELDLSTAVTMAPRQFEGSLSLLERLRRGVHTLGRAVSWAGAGCLLLWAGLWLLSGVTVRTLVCWLGITLLVAGTLGLGLGLIASSMAPSLIATGGGPRLFSELPDDLAAPLGKIVAGYVPAVCALVFPWASFLAGLGLVLTVSALCMPGVRLRRQWTAVEGAPRALVALLAAGFLLWTAYTAAGQRIYDRAFAAHREGDADEAAALYVRLERLYPAAVDGFVVRARRGLRECQRYLEAEQAYRLADYDLAAQLYEAFLVAGSTLSLRGSAQEHLLDSLYRSAESLRQEGEHERALDRYRFIREAYRDRHIDRAIADLHFARGEALQAEGDFRAALVTYRRVLYDVSDPRLWAAADDRIADVYCAWGTSLRARGYEQQTQEVCSELRQELPSADAAGCPACRP